MRNPTNEDWAQFKDFVAFLVDAYGIDVDLVFDFGDESNPLLHWFIHYANARELEPAWFKKRKL